MSTRTSFFLKLMVVLCVVSVPGGLLAAPANTKASTKPSVVTNAKANAKPATSAPALNVSTAATLGPILPGSNMSVINGTYESGLTASGSGTCLINFTNGGGTLGQASVIIPVSPGSPLSIVNKGTGFTSAPTLATVTSGGTATDCAGTSIVVSTTIGDPLDLIGLVGTVTTSIDPVGATYNPVTETYTGLKITITETTGPFPGASFSCTGANATVTLNDSTAGGNDTLKLGGCTLLFVTEQLASLSATLAFAPGTIPAPLPLAFSAPLISSSPNYYSQASYTCLLASLCEAAVGTSASLGISGSIETACTSACPGETVNGSATPTALNFSMTYGGTAPSTQTASVSTSPDNMAFAVTTSAGATWLTINGSSTGGGTTGSSGTSGSFTVGVTPGTLIPGSYSGNAVVYTSATNSPVTLPVKFTINPPAPPTITTTSLPNGKVGTLYSQTLAASGGVLPYTWSISSGALPPGLTLASSTGIISGTPTTSTGSPFSFTVKLTDDIGETATQGLSITVTGGVNVTTTSLIGGEVGAAYSQTLAASGGTAPYTWSITAGSLPPGLSLTTSTGLISGTPNTTTGSPFSFSVTATDSVGNVSPAQPLSISVIAGPSVSTTSLPSGEVGIAYNQTLHATGGSGTYTTWTVAGGALPPGLSLASSTGVISGSPSTTTGSPFSFTVTVKDSAGSTSPAQPLSITVISGVSITTGSLPNGVAGTSYSFALGATGGTKPYTWSATGLPLGLSLNTSTGVISGTPSSAGTSTVNITVTDAVGSSGSTSLPLTIVSPLTITTTSLPGGVVGDAYNQSVAVSGGTPPYTWSVASGSLPTGLSLNTSTGAISGTPSTAGSYSFGIGVKDSGGLSTGEGYTVVIAPVLSITTPALPNGVVGVSYSATLAASGGVTPYTWSATGLPGGLSLNTSTGAITGTPNSGTAGSYTVNVTVTDSVSDVAHASFPVTITSGLTITTASLPNGEQGVGYSQTLSAAGGVPPYSNWTVSSGALPGGLSLNASTGVISGTPTGTGLSSFSVTVQDSTHTTSPAQALTITIASPVTVSTTSLPNGTLSVGYSQALAASNGNPPYSNWTVSSGSLPGGLSLNASTGVISGTPSAAGTSSFSVTVQDSTPATSAAQKLSITIIGALTITTTGALPNGTVGAAYSQTLVAAGGVPPYNTWTVSSGSLPAGLSLNASTGVISGTPSAVGSSSFSVTVKDSAGNTSPAASLSISIVSGLVVQTSGALPSGNVGTAYSQTLTASGGVPPYSNWTVTTGALPGGLSLNSSSGVISGTPTAAGTFNFSVTVKDSASNTSPAQALSIVIIGPVGISTTTLPSGNIGVAYSQTLGASGGVPPYSNWTVTTGSLPPGLTLTAASGVISGTPTAGGTYSFSVTVKDSTGAVSAAQALSISIITPITVTTTSLLGGPPGVPYSQTLTASGGIPPYTWAVTSGSLPPGLALNTSTGTISGTPTTTGTYTFSVTVTDTTKTTSPAKSLSIVVSTAVLKLTPPALNFGLTSTAGPSSTTFTIAASDGSAQPFTIVQGSSSNNWLKLSATSGTTPATITATATPTGLVPGTYTIVLTITAPSLPNPTATMYANLTISGSNLSASPTMLTFAYQPGTALPAAQSVTISTLNGATVALSSVTTDVQWLQVTTATSAPATVKVTINPGLLTAGTYSGDVLVRGVGSTSTDLDVPVILTVNAMPALTVTPAALTFNTIFGSSAPPSQTLAVATGSVGLSFTATSPGSWLQVVPTRGTTPATITVTAVPAGLAPGTYGGTININALGATNSSAVAVTLTIASASAVSASPTSLSFTAPVGGPAPNGKPLAISSTTSSAVSFTATTSASWLSVGPTSGTTPATLMVAVNPAGLTAGGYMGAVDITPAGGSATLVVSVSLEVGTGPQGQLPAITGVINAASGAVGKLAPGMAISIFGTNLGPATGVSFTAPEPGGTVATTLGGTQVLVNGTAVPVLFAWATQVNALVPFELANDLSSKTPTADLQVVYGGQTSLAETLPLQATLPGLFAANGAGTGEGAILNQDSSVNSTSNPAAPGSVIQLFGTGGGVTNPPSTDGALNPLTTTGQLVAAVTVTIGGQPATVDYSGPAPSLVAGVFQINATIPSGTPAGNAAVVVTIGGVASQTGLTVAVQ